MQLNIDSFREKKSTQDRIEESIASNIQIKGLEKIAGLSEHLAEIFENYELENGVFKLKNEICDTCNKKLKRKEKYNKEITLPGGITILLTFYQYSCPHCKTKVRRRLGDWFAKGERYSSNIKSDAVRLYLSHLSSYDAVHKELMKTYQIPHLSKRTVRRWIKNVGVLAPSILEEETDFSGHFVYDEEYLKVFVGDVGKKGAKLKKIEVYLLLFRDAITQKVIIMLSDSLDKSILINHWRAFVKWTLKKEINFLTLTTDGRREYNAMINELNREFNLKIQHSYCIFHFKQNLFEVSNKYIFGVMKTKKDLPEHIKNQIKEIEKAIDQPTKDLFENELSTLIHQKQTYIKPLQDQIRRLKKYSINYALHKQYPFLRTTNTCEQWFGQTKPQKIKKGYKTKQGLLNVVSSLATKITNENWKKLLKIPKDIENATDLLVSTLIHKKRVF